MFNSEALTIVSRFATFLFGGLLVVLVLFGVISLVVWYGARMVSEGSVTEEQFMRFLFFSIFVGGSFGAFPEIMGQLNKASGAGDRIIDLLDQTIEFKSPGDPHAPGTLGERGRPTHTAPPPIHPRVQGSIQFDAVEFAYPSRPDVTVLQGIGFDARAGERIALVGPSGAGKSTITQLLMRFYDPAAGAIRVDGRDLREFDLDELRAQMAVVPQEVLLFGGSIFDNIRYGKPTADRAAVERAARQANAWEFIEKLPEGLDTLVGDRGVKLSGGQRQRVAIARAILVNPAILILDEATSSLDAESERLVQQALSSLMEGRTSIIIAHRLATIRHAHQIIVLKDGEVAERGNHSELIRKEGGLYQMLARLQFGLENDSPSTD
jgi:ABC-type multidrug transport system fused ATPase/permease subunit